MSAYFSDTYAWLFADEPPKHQVYAPLSKVDHESAATGMSKVPLKERADGNRSEEGTRTEEDDKRELDLMPPELRELHERTSSRFWVVLLLVSVADGAIMGCCLQWVNNVFAEKPQDMALFVGLVTIITSLTALFTKSIYGPMSDRVGRKWLLIFHYVSESAFATLLAWKPTVTMMVIYLGASSLTGTGFLLRVIVMDLSSHSSADISQQVGRYYALVGIGAFVAFPISLLLPFQTGLMGAVLFFLIFVVYASIALPETLPLAQALLSTTDSPRQSDARLIEYNPFVLMKILDTSPITRNCSMAWLMNGVATCGIFTLFAAYTDERFGWGSAQQGMYILMSGLLIVSCNLCINTIQRNFSTAFTLQWGAASVVVSAVCISLAFRGYDWIMGISLLVLVPFGNVYTTMLMGVISSELPKNKQGHLQGAVDSLTSICAAIGPLSMTPVYSIFVSDNVMYFPQAPIVLGVLFLMVGMYYTVKVAESLAPQQASLDHHKTLLSEKTSLIQPSAAKEVDTSLL